MKINIISGKFFNRMRGNIFNHKCLKYFLEKNIMRDIYVTILYKIQSSMNIELLITKVLNSLKNIFRILSINAFIKSNFKVKRSENFASFSCSEHTLERLSVHKKLFVRRVLKCASSCVYGIRLINVHHGNIIILFTT